MTHFFLSLRLTRVWRPTRDNVRYLLFHGFCFAGLCFVHAHLKPEFPASPYFKFSYVDTAAHDPPSCDIVALFKVPVVAFYFGVFAEND